MPDIDVSNIREIQDQNRLVAHYTTMEVLHGLIQNASGTGEHLVLNFWASCIFALNDPDELMYGYDVISNWLPEIEDEMQISEENRLSNISKLLNDTKNLELHKAIKDYIYKCPQIPYIISFSNSLDNLDMFRLYSNEGNGVTIVFSYGELLKDNVKLFEVMYQTKKNPDTYDSYDMVKTVYRDFIKKVDGISDSQRRLEKMLECIASLSLVVSSFIKNGNYENENEIRFLRLSGKNDDMKFRLSKFGNIVPYIIQEIPITAIKKIIVGPCADYLTTKKMIDLELLSKGVDWIPVEKSKTNYRRY